MGVLSQNHSWNGLTRPAQINDNLSPAAAGSPEQRCRVEPQPGFWRRSGHRPGTSAASPGRPGGSAPASAASGVRSGLGGTGRPGRGAGGGEEALAGVGESCGHSRSAQPGPSGCGQRLRLALAGREWRRLQEISNQCLRWSPACWGTGAGAPELTEKRTAAHLPAKCEKDSGTLHKATLLAFSLPAAPRGQALGDGGEGTARSAAGAGALRKVLVGIHC